MAEDHRRIAHPSGALGGGRVDRREERFLEDVRREIRREVAAIRDEVAHAVERKLTEGWERLEHMLAQQAEEAKKQAAEDRKWRLDVARRLEALEQALRVGPAFQGSEEERGKDIERGTKRARVESEGKADLGSPPASAWTGGVPARTRETAEGAPAHAGGHPRARRS
jgi:hypothetical protein